MPSHLGERFNGVHVGLGVSHLGGLAMADDNLLTPSTCGDVACRFSFLLYRPLSDLCKGRIRLLDFLLLILLSSTLGNYLQSWRLA